MADEKGAEYLRSSIHDDPSTRIWSSYLSGAERRNTNLARSWKGDMDAILIFAGLFSASVTAFLIESYKTLSPNPDDMTISLLAQISQQLTVMTNVSVPTNVAWTPPVLNPHHFTPATSALVCNTLWFLSLGFSLACALSATLIEQWVRIYLQESESPPTPHERARICEYLYSGLERFEMSALVEAIPMLLHISLLLFFAGLVEFLHPVNSAMSALVLAMLLICTVLYALATIIPIFQRDCPYRTPLSGGWWRIFQACHLLRRRDAHGGTMLISGTMAQAREADAIDISPQRDQRDMDAMCWTLRSLREDAELESFVDVIPMVVAGFDYSAKLLLHRLLYHDDLSIRLGHRIPRLLITCTGGVLDPVQGQKRAATCLAAIWSLNMMSVPTHGSISPLSSRATLRFNEKTLRDVRTVGFHIPAVADYAISVLAVIARNLLDMHTDWVVTKKRDVAALVHWGAMGAQYQPPTAPKFRSISEDVVHGLGKIQRRAKTLEKYLCSDQGLDSQLPYMKLNKTSQDLDHLISIIAAAPVNASMPDLVGSTLQQLQEFHATLNQIGFSLTVEYAANLLDSRSLPHEAFNTIRRIFLKIDFKFRFSLESQRRLVIQLDNALESDSEGLTRIPQSIINIILGLTQAVKDPSSAMKATSIIGRYMRFFPNDEAAQKAMSTLSEVLPQPIPTLELFSSHMYADIKLDGQGRP